MLIRRSRQTARSRMLVFWIVLALLFGQGLRMCVHTLGGDGPEHATPIHVESALTGADDKNASAPDHDTVLPALLKTAVTALVFCAVLASALFLFLPATSQVHSRFWNTPLPPSGRYWLIPPGHAPPR